MNKKKIIMVIILILFAVGIGIAFVKISDKSVKANEKSGSFQEVSGKKVDIEITDNFFIEQTNDIFLNLKDYVGKTVKMEGLIYTYIDQNGETRVCCSKKFARMLWKRWFSRIRYKIWWRIPRGKYMGSNWRCYRKTKNSNWNYSNS